MAIYMSTRTCKLARVLLRSRRRAYERSGYDRGEGRCGTPCRMPPFSNSMFITLSSILFFENGGAVEGVVF